MRTLLFSALCALVPHLACAQADSLGRALLSVQLYTDQYLSMRTPAGTDGRILPFLYNHNRDCVPALNLGLVKLSVAHSRVRANVALHAGTYVNDNYAAEPGWVRPIAEADVGVAISKRHRLWADVGIMPSHIGFESAVSMDNATLSRSMLAENSPYYEAAAKLTWEADSAWTVSVLVCNGWQRIRPVPGNTLPGIGTQLIWRPRSGMTLNWSTFIGTDDPDSTRRVRFFNNLYGQFVLGAKWGLTAGLDVGMQQQGLGSGLMDVWFSPVLIAKWMPVRRVSLAARAEYYRDSNGVMVADGPAWGGGIAGASLNIDLWLTRHLVFRTEGRWLGGTRAGAPQVFSLIGMLGLRVGS